MDERIDKLIRESAEIDSEVKRLRQKKYDAFGKYSTDLLIEEAEARISELERFVKLARDAGDYWRNGRDLQGLP